MSANDILGKIGEKVGSEFSNLRVSLSTNYATKVSLGNVVNTIDFTPYATKVSLNGVVTSLGNARVSLGGRLTTLENAGYATTSEVDLKASKVSIDSLKNGTDIFSVLSATRAEIGDLNVTGTTTTINTQTLSVEDNIIEVNLKSDGSETAQTGGIEVNRGDAVASVNETLGVDIQNFQVQNSGGFVVAMSWVQDNSPVSFNVSNSLPQGNETDQHFGKLQPSSGWIHQSSADLLSFDFDTDGKIVAIDRTGASGQSTTTRRIVGFSYVGGVEDKAKFIWDDSGQGSFKALLGSAATTLEVGVLKVPNSSGIKINNVDLGDYATFELAFLAEL